MISIEELLQTMVSRGASDLHIAAGSPPRIRVDGKLLPLALDPLTRDETKKIIYGLLSEEQIARYEKELELDFSFGIENLGRFRVNVFSQRGSLGMAIRLVPSIIRSFEELGLPRSTCVQLCDMPKGLILVTGATGSGKSTTIASMVEYINQTYEVHIVTVEDPIEFVFQNKKGLVNQREILHDTLSFKNSLKHVLRQDPDVVLIGEMRDNETVEAALTISETGHLTFGTLHTSDIAQTVNRVVDIFPAHQQEQVRTQLSMTLTAVFCQQLIPRSRGKGRVLAMEVMICTPAIRALIRENKIHQIYSAVQTSGHIGMKTMNTSLFELYKSGALTYEDALVYSYDPEELKRMVMRG